VWDEPVLHKGSGASLTVYIPITGDPSLLGCYNTYRSLPPIQAELDGATLVYTFSLPKDQIGLAQERLAKLKKYTEEYLPHIHRFVSHVKEQMLDAAKQPLQQRLSELQADKKALEQFSSLGFPIRQRKDEIAQAYVPVQRRAITIPDSPRQLEENPFITIQAYEDILRTITAMARGFERSPSAFKEMKEEDLRFVLLLGLNATYEGKATGETFNGHGKTDILVRVGDRNIFIAECFVWDGIKTAESKLDNQLMSYAMWRDTKTALIVFNRSKNLTAVLRKLKSSVSAHPQCIQELPYASETGFRCLFRRKDDPDRHFYLTCLVFDVPTP
jgi:hypothetical protein